MSKRIRILMVGPSPKARGGIASVVKQYYEAGIDKKVDLRYLSTTVDGNNTIKLFFFALSLIRVLFALPFCDIVHAHMSSGNSYTRKSCVLSLARLFKKKTIIHLHSGAFDTFFHKCSPDRQKRIKKSFSKADKVIVLSEEWHKRICDLCGEAVGNKTIVFHNAVSVPEYQKTDYDNSSIIFMGNVSETKGIGILLESIRLLKTNNELESISLTICGDGVDKQKYETLTEELGLTDNVHFCGWVNEDEKDHLYRESSIFVLPSFFEGLPMSLLEAMSYGLAVIVSAVGGIPSVVSNMQNGILISPQKVDELADAILALYKNAELKKQLGEKAYRTIVRDFNIRTMVDNLVLVYFDI